MKNKLRNLAAVITSVFLAACSDLAVFAVNAPTSFGGHALVESLEFGRNGQTLDIYIPENAQENSMAPVLMFFYGGRWSEGRKEQYKFIGNRFAKHGYVTVISDYRKYPSVKFPTFVEDNADAAAWVHKNIKKYGGNANSLFLAGHSAGALNAALLSVDERYLKKRGVELSSIQGFIGLAGPYDFEPDEPDLKDMFGPPKNYPQMQVSTFIDGSEPPMLLLYGLKDDTVWYSNIQKLKKAIDAKNGKVIVKTYNDLDHLGIISALTWVYKDKYTVDDDILTFLEKHK